MAAEIPSYAQRAVRDAREALEAVYPAMERAFEAAAQFAPTLFGVRLALEADAWREKAIAGLSVPTWCAGRCRCGVG